ncbi:MAG: adenylosuccinate synthase [Planctomycetes bacterium]|nr:adenylosuccinate synthase [Planctomycetota bacterium]
MTVSCVVGVQWGDEGKGKVIDFLTRGVQWVARFQGGANAGHTVVVGGDEFILHLIPSGILHPGVRCVIGNGVVVDPRALLAEIDELGRRGVRVDGRLLVSDRAHVVFPYHKAMDSLAESGAGEGQRLGTTRRGIGPAYADKARRTGVRVADLYDRPVLEACLRFNVRERNALLGSLADPRPPYHEDPDALLEEYRGLAEALRPYVADTVAEVHAAVERGETVLLEGAQGTLLDIDYGTYPYVTSSNTVAGAVCTGLGLPPRAIDRVVGVLKAYSTRVGEGPFPTEEPGGLGEHLRARGGEYGATTGRPRRCGWLDAVSVRHALRLDGVDELVLTKLDVLDEVETVRVCTAYRLGDRRVDHVPAARSDLAAVVPVYEDLPGWRATTDGVERFEDLPREARSYVDFLERLLGCPIGLISVGRRRDQVIVRGARD